MPELQQATSLHVKYILILICDIWHWSCRDWLIRFQVHTTRRGRDNEKRLALFQTLHFIWVKAACSQNSYRTNKLITYWTIFCHFLKTLINSGIKVIKILSDTQSSSSSYHTSWGIQYGNQWSLLLCRWKDEGGKRDEKLGLRVE